MKRTRHSVTLIRALPIWFNLVCTLVHVGYVDVNTVKNCLPGGYKTHVSC